jgi:hypothetical protein
MRIAHIVVAAFVTIAAVFAGTAGASRPLIGGTPLLVCYPGNTADRSSDGCVCASSSECIGSCSATTHTCGGVTGALTCSAPNNTFDASANGCPCVNNNTCQGVCILSTMLCGGNGAVGPICVPGNTADLSAAGCPCQSDNECDGACSAFSKTCGGVVGRVDDVQPTLNATATPLFAPVGTQVSDAATLSGALHPTGTVRFNLYPPSDPSCSGTPVSTVNRTVSANGQFNSNAFVVTNNGGYRWRAVYSGDAYNLDVSPSCGGAGQTVIVGTELIFRNGFDPVSPQ